MFSDSTSIMQLINLQELQEKLNDIGDVTVINTLAPQRFDQTTIPGSINVDQRLDDFVERVSLVVTHNHDAKIVLYGADAKCDSPRMAAEKLEAAGFGNVFTYPGGYQDWMQANPKSAQR